MKYTDVLMTAYDDMAFREAYRTYIAEMGCRVTNWDGLFAAMGETGRDYAWTQRDEDGRVVGFASGMSADERDYTWTRRDEDGRVMGFIQFTPMELTSWFFWAKVGFIREFWMAPEMRRQGHGTELLQMAEKELKAQGCAYAILTTDTAPDFYRKSGYTLQSGITARNASPVYAKAL